MSRGGPRPARALLLVALLLAVPLASGASAHLVTEDAMTLAGKATLRLAPQAIVVGDPPSLDTLTLTSPRVHVYLAIQQTKEVDALNVQTTLPAPHGGVREFVLHDVVVTLVRGGINGSVGIYPREGGMADMSIRSAVALAPHAALQMGGGDDSQGDEGAPDQPGYARTLTGPTLAIVGDGALAYQGPGRLKVHGPTVLVASRENTTEYETGRRTEGDLAVRDLRHVWLTFAFEEGEVRLGHPRIEAAAPSAAVSWVGRATFSDLDGRVDADDATHDLAQDAGSLDGSFEGLVVAREGPDGRAVAQVDVEGHLSASSMFRTSSAAPAPLLRPLGWLGLVLVSVAIGVGGAWAWLRRREADEPPPLGLSVEQYRDLADAAMENLRFGDALSWIQKAQVHAPGSARLWMDRGYCHACLGDVAAALSAYARAADLSADGEADLLAASLHLRGSKPDLDAAERHVERAVERTPTLALEVQLDSTFDPLRGRPRFTRAMRRALGEKG